MPLPVTALLLLLGWVALYAGRRLLARILLSLAVTVIVLSTLSPVSYALLMPLEYRYAAVDNTSNFALHPHYVAVLGGGYQPRAGVSVTAALGADSVMRLAEGIRLFRELPGAMLILSGGSSLPPQPGTGRGYALAAQELGIPPSSLIVLDQALDTRQEIRAIRERVGDEPVLLVTSAAHMPRAMGYCERFGVHAVPAPTGHLTVRPERLNVMSFVPSGSALHKTETALHEYIGLLLMETGGP